MAGRPSPVRLPDPPVAAAAAAARERRLKEEDVPTRLVNRKGTDDSQRRAAQLLAQASPELARVHLVRVSVMAFDAQGSEHVVRRIPLAL